MTVIAVTIAGSDSGGGAGIQADLKTFSALGVYGASVITALTAQNTRGVSAIHSAPMSFLAAQMDAVFSDLAVNAVKIGMLADVATVETVAAGLIRHQLTTVVIDPVMVAASGDALTNGDTVAALKAKLFPLGLIVTPNLPEAARLLDQPIADSAEAMIAQGQALLAMGARAALIKGGHGHGGTSDDVLVTKDGVSWYSAPRHDTQNTHGTGCTLSSAIAAELAKGHSLQDAVATAKLYVTATIQAADGLRIGHGHGPVHHFHGWWTV